MLPAGLVERADASPSLVSPSVEPSFSPETEQFVFDLAVSFMNGTPHNKLPSLNVLAMFVQRLQAQTINTPAVFKRFADETSDLLARRDLGLSLRMGQHEPPLLPHNQLLLETRRADYAIRINRLMQEVV